MAGDLILGLRCARTCYDIALLDAVANASLSAVGAQRGNNRVCGAVVAPPMGGQGLFWPAIRRARRIQGAFWTVPRHTLVFAMRRPAKPDFSRPFYSERLRRQHDLTAPIPVYAVAPQMGSDLELPHVDRRTVQWRGPSDEPPLQLKVIPVPLVRVIGEYLKGAPLASALSHTPELVAAVEKAAEAGSTPSVAEGSGRQLE